MDPRARDGTARAGRGKAVQVDPIKPKLKAPGAKRLKLKCDILLSIFAFKFNLRRYTEGERLTPTLSIELASPLGRGLHSSTFRLNISAFCGI